MKHITVIGTAFRLRRDGNLVTLRERVAASVSHGNKKVAATGEQVQTHIADSTRKGDSSLDAEKIPDSVLSCNIKESGGSCYYRNP